MIEAIAVPRSPCMGSVSKFFADHIARVIIDKDTWTFSEA